jgi:RNA recognition motif-containing protein
MSAKLFVGNLPFKATQEEIGDLFSQHGSVTEVQLMMDRVTGRPRGFGFVTMGSPEEAQKAVTALHGLNFGGRDLTVNLARPMEPRAPRQ